MHYGRDNVCIGWTNIHAFEEGTLVHVHNDIILNQAIEKKRKLVKDRIIIGLTSVVFIAVMIWSKITSVDFHNSIINDEATKQYILVWQVYVGSSVEIITLLMVSLGAFKGWNPIPLFIAYVIQFTWTTYISFNYDEFTYINHELDMFLISNWIFVFIQCTYATISTWISYTNRYYVWFN